jgi:hypothetical protein
MDVTAKRSLILFLLLISIVLAACGLSPEQVQQAVATVDNM